MTNTEIISVVALLASAASSAAFTHPTFVANRAKTAVFMSSAGPGIEVVSQPDEEFLNKKGVFDWGTWGCGVSKFPWSYGDSESCYLLEGKVTVTPTDGRPAATFGKGDFVTFPAGMSCTWDVTEAVKKHYMFF
uniref:(S)-ureidoglycine aminohydrolase cupin domain-containing protein n=1 Tax=Ditylum brightwellii TaxID=49249 RepID=A0A6U3W9G6_9STRA|mmetsp:Transcript_40715/g.60996  ORF Transcript_40715/g.60996 Transcript_40715/m.60996 type:complete len:134 (+) Transcript_40715:54-455(+)